MAFSAAYCKCNEPTVPMTSTSSSRFVCTFFSRPRLDILENRLVVLSVRLTEFSNMDAVGQGLMMRETTGHARLVPVPIFFLPGQMVWDLSLPI